MISFFVEHKTAANLLMAIFLLLGIFFVFQIRRETLPDFSKDQVKITAVYPGATAEEVEEAVCQRIEDAVDKVNNVKEVISLAQEGVGSVTIEMESGGDFQQFQNDIKTEVEAIDNFPDLVEKPIIKPLNRTDNVLSIAVTGPMSVSDLKSYCEQLKDKLKRMPEISQVEIKGFSQHQFKIEIPQKVLMAYGLSIPDLAKTISEQNTNLPAGTLKTDEQDFSIRFDDRRRTLRDLKNITVIAGSSGAEIKLGRIAKIYDDFELGEDKLLFNGKRAGLLVITKPKSKDSLKIYDEVQEFLKHERLIKPAGVNFYITNNVALIIRSRLDLLVNNGIQGIILVFLVLWLFFNLRFSFWVAMGLPVSFLGAMFFIHALNISLNMISMVALLIAIGLLMDDAIVISENIATHVARGKKAVEAAIAGTKEVSVGVLASLATTICVFGALFGVEGDVGKILRVIPIVLTIVLLVSMVEAFLILPNHLAHSLHKKGLDSPSRLRAKINSVIDRIRNNIIGRLARKAIPHRYTFIACVLGVFIASIGLVAGGIVKFRLFPDIDGDTIVARVLMPQGTPLSKTEKIAEKIVDALKKVNEHYKKDQPGGKDLIENSSVQFNLNTDAGESGAHVVTVSADLLPGDERRTSVNDIVAYWRKASGKIPNVISLSFKDFQPGPGGTPVYIRLKGSELKTLKRASTELQQKLKNYSGVYDITDDMRPGKMELILKLKPGALKEGLTSRSIASQLRAAYHGSVADEVQIDSESYEICVKLSDVRKDNIKYFDNFFIKMNDGRQIPLHAVCSIKSGRGFAGISRKDGIRSVSVKAEVDRKKANAAEIIADLRANYLPGLCKRYPGIWTDFEGETKESKETGSSMGRSFLIGIIGIFILLSFQFKSYAEPLIVMIAIPLAIVGVIWGHMLMNVSLCMPSMMGFISLSGIVVNDSILLMEFIKIKVNDGHNVENAAIEASMARFRPVMLTSLTTIAGLLPLLAEKSMQAQILIPLAISIVFGLAASTVMVLFVVPSLYMIYQDWHPKTKTE